MGWFSNFKAELQEAIEEGRAEAREELAQETAEEQGETNVAAEAYAQASAREKFEVALGAPYRELFVGGLDRADAEKRPAYELCIYLLPEKKKNELRQYLERDFGIVDVATLVQAVAGMEAALYARMFDHAFELETKNEVRTDLSDEELKAKIDRAAGTRDAIHALADALDRYSSENAQGIDGATLQNQRTTVHDQCEQLLVDVSVMAKMDEDLLALWMARISYMVAIAVGVGYIPQSEAEHYLVEIMQLGVPLFSSWEEYADAYLRGEKTDKTNNALGRKILASKTKALLASEQSPWNLVPWPEMGRR